MTYEISDVVILKQGYAWRGHKHIANVPYVAIILDKKNGTVYNSYRFLIQGIPELYKNWYIECVIDKKLR